MQPPSSPDPSSRFYEIQHFRQWWLWLLVGGAFALVTGIIGFGFYRQAVHGIPFDTHPNPMSTAGVAGILALTILMQGGILMMILMMNLRTTVGPDGLHVRFMPFVRDRLIRFDEIAECQARQYRPILEYGGWGLRYGWKSGMAYNAMGDRGVQLVLRNGKRVLIGSQRSEELERVLLEGMAGN